MTDFIPDHIRKMMADNNTASREIDDLATAGKCTLQMKLGDGFEICRPADIGAQEFEHIAHNDRCSISFKHWIRPV